MEAKKFNNLEKMFSNMTDKQRHQYLLDEYSRLIEDKGYDGDTKENKIYSNERHPNYSLQAIIDTIKSPITTFSDIKETINRSYEYQNKYNSQSNLNDKFKHAVISCENGQRGAVPAETIKLMGYGKELADITKKGTKYFLGSKQYGNLKDIFEDSQNDLKANKIGRNLGYSNPYSNCEEMVEVFYHK